METKNKNFQILRALDVAAIFGLLVFVALFIKTVLALANSFQSEAYTNAFAGLTSI